MAQPRSILLVALASGIAGLGAPAAPTPISDGVYAYVNGLISSIREHYFIFQTADSGFNHGTPSGLFANDASLLTSDALNGSCIFDARATDGCSLATNVYDKSQSFLRLKIPALQQSGVVVQYFGLNFEEPESYGVNRVGDGVDISGATAVAFEIVAKTAAPCQVKFAVRGSETDFLDLPSQITPITLAFGSLYPPLRRLVGVHTLFSIATDAIHCSGGGSVLVRNIEFNPRPNSVLTALGFPVANKTFGIRPNLAPCSKLGSMDVPADQSLKNPAPIYESSLVLMGLLSRPSSDLASRASARIVADAFVYALNHPNTSLSFPPRPYRSTPGGSSGPEALLNNSYRSGPIGFSDPQPLADKTPGGPGKGEMALSGFSAGKDPSNPQVGNFCLILDGATGGNNAFAMLALVAASRAFENGADEPYLASARQIAQWIVNNLWSEERENPKSYGGFYIGWNDGGDRLNGFLYGKSVENNADIYAAMRVLADREMETGDIYNKAADWNNAAIHAGDFVGKLRIHSSPQSASDHFFAGTVPCSQRLNAGLIPQSYCPASDTRSSNYSPEKDPAFDSATMRVDPTLIPDVMNIYDFLDATTFVALALAGSDDYGAAFGPDPMDWRQPMSWSVGINAVSGVSSYGRLASGFDLVRPNYDYSAELADHLDTPADGPQALYPPGITWEFTGQVVVTMLLLNSIYLEQPFSAAAALYLDEIRKTQSLDHFAEGGGLPAATLNPATIPAKQEASSDMPGPYYSCLQTPYQCFPSRVGLAATMWAAFAETGFNPLGRPRPKR